MRPSGSNFDGAAVLITAAGSPLGRAYGLYLAHRGATVLANDTDERACSKTVEHIALAGGKASMRIGSPGDPETAGALVDECMHLFGRLDVVVHAPPAAGFGRVEDLDPSVITCVLRDALLGTILVSRAAVPVMRTASHGRIVATASGVGAFGQALSSIYAAASAGVIGFTRSLSLELLGTGIAVNAVAPIATTDGVDCPIRTRSALDCARYSLDVIAPIVAYLCSPGCALTGEVLSVGAGRIARIFASTTIGHFDPSIDEHTLEFVLDRVVAAEHAIAPRSAGDELLLIDV